MAIGSKNKNLIMDAIRDRKPFTYASMTGGPVNSETGRLPQNLVILLRNDEPTYVIRSYGTPIAWVRRNGTICVPDERYSATTSNHQGIARQALA